MRRCLVVALAGALTACSGGTAQDRTGSSRTPLRMSTEEYRPGVEGDLYLPAATDGPVAVVVLVPGGGWQTADRRGLAPLAERLADDGMVVYSERYRAAIDGATFPTPVDDVACSVRFARRRAAQEGFRPGPLVVVGHSAGAHLAALAALAPGRFGQGCPSPPAEPDGLVGLAGAYDLRALADVAAELIGARPDEMPDRWEEADASTWAASRPGLPVLLVHGEADHVVPASITSAFAHQLEAGGHPVSVVLVPGAEHQEVYRPDVVGDRLAAWIRSVPAG